MKALSVYSGGCDGLSLAGSWVGIETVALCECDPHCREQLKRRHPDKPIFVYDTEVTCDALQGNGIEPGTITASSGSYSGESAARGHKGSTQPGLGSLLDGISGRLAAQQWPAGRGAEQYEWEAPRTVTGMKYRAQLIKMLGNAVVPQWALIALAGIVEMENLLQWGDAL